MAKDANWYEGGSKHGLPGMKRYAASDRKIERKITDYPDGRRETVETIIEENIKSDWFSAGSFFQYKAAAKVFKELAMPAAQQEIPFHSLQSMKNDIIREIEQRQTATLLPYNANKAR